MTRQETTTDAQRVMAGRYRDEGTVMTQTEHPKWMRLAAFALHAAQRDDARRMAYYIKRINDECQGAGLYSAVLAWCDAVCQHASGMVDPPPAKVNMTMIRGDTGTVGNDDPEMPEPAGWAGRLIAARAAMDQELYGDVLDELPDDGFVRAEYVYTLLRCAGQTIARLPRGYGRRPDPTLN